MASGRSRHTLFALWNNTDEADDRHPGENSHKKKSLHRPIPRTLRSSSANPRSVQDVSHKCVSQAFDASRNDSRGILQDKDRKYSRHQRGHPPNSSLTRDPRHSPCDRSEPKQDKRTAFSKKGGKGPNPYRADCTELPRLLNRITGRPVPNRSRRFVQVDLAPEHISTSESEEAATNEVKPKIKKSNEVIRPMSYTRLQSLIPKEPDEILFTLISPYNGFQKLIELQNIPDKMMPLILVALGKVSKSKMRENVMAFVNSVTSQNTFMFFNLQMYMVVLQGQRSDAILYELQHLIEFLKTFVDSQPATASKTLSVLTPMLLKTIDKCDQNNSVCSCVKEALNDIIKQTELFVEQHTEKEIIQATAEEKIQLQKPPEDFHEIPILPTIHDVYNYQPFLRPNIVEGKYRDMDHYLDVQFRLLREDFVRPLREGIAEFRILKNKEKIRRCKDLRVYLNVHVVGSEFIHGTLVHLLQFDAEKFKKVAWEYSKRFLTGSLLCLSNDNFKTMFFATVLQREPKQLTKGILMIKFEELVDDIHSISPLTDFVVLETEAYFEAYRHILLALQNITDFQLKQYIVDVEKNVGGPRYLSANTTYDISPLLLPINTLASQSTNADSSRSEHIQNPANSRLTSLPILNDSLWPKEDTVGLDASQLKALKVALTKEFSVIQGPPGTGKTYIGLRIVQLLLHNATKWNSAKSPILVVCYTNHALDQFLEGILNFTQKIGRIGGRCNSEKVEPYLLRNLRSKIRTGRNIPGHIFFNIREKTTLLSALQREVSETEHLMERGTKSVLGEEVLKPYMKSAHYASLKRSILYLRNDPLMSSTLDDGHIIYDWLEIRFRGFELGELAKSIYNINLSGDQQKSVVSNNRQYEGDQLMWLDAGEVEENKGDEDDESAGEKSSEGEADIDFIEAMREVDEDFSGVKFHLRETVEDFLVVDEGNWKTQMGPKSRKKFIQKMLRQAGAMSCEEADKVVDIWKLTYGDRWRLYRFWLTSYICAKQEEINETQKRVCQEYKQLCEMKMAEDLHAMEGLEIVGMTTTGAAKYRNILQTLNPCVVIVEEAAEILESHIITSLSPNTQHLILIGDHQQLRPSPTVYQLATKYNLDISLFERMIKNKLEPCVLSIQHRMRPEIASLLVPHIYAELKNDESVLGFENIKGVTSNIFFLNHSYCEGRESDSASKVNNHEALFLIEFCRYLLLQGYLASQLTILTAYSGQLMLLKKLTNKNPLYRGVRITVVDNFQGEENDIILISFVRSNEEGLIGFLKTANRVCVALSRAKKGLYCIGNFMLLAEQSKLWKDILTTLENQNAVGDALELCCQNHPNCSNLVSSPGDFNLVPEGGCTRPCEYRLECGHTCTRMCHPYDPLHEKFQCKKKCGKISCELGHLCQKQCFQICGKCCVEVCKVIPRCKHKVLVPCYLDPLLFKCSVPCSKKLPCGHPCTNTCGQECVLECRENITVSSLCGHTISVSCFQAKSVLSVVRSCRKRCNKELDCGHLCSGTCSDCYQGRLHIPCKNPCQRVLVCGHQCNSECARNCPPCQKECPNRCAHSKCPNQCGVPCNPCTEKCEWWCVHQECTRLCSEPCDRTPCDKPCSKLLRCGHRCVGLCGEPCPKLCGVCDSAQLREVFFGTEDDEDARFIMLEDCGHVFEVSGLTQWMKLGNDKSGEIQMKCCPRCKTVIRRNLRFSSIVKACLGDVAKVKLVTFGEQKKIERNKKKLLKRMKFELRFSDSLIKPITNLLKKRSLSIWDVERCENIVNIAANLQEICAEQQLDIFLLVQGLSWTHKFGAKIGGIDIDSLNECICETAALIDRFLHVENKTATFQQMKEITCELRRLKILATMWQMFQKCRSKIDTNADVRNTFVGILNQLTGIRFIPFSESREEQLRKSIKNLMQMCSFSVLGVSDAEKKLILHAMSLSVGHWYQCPNGHVYCITECGGAMETSRCNECGAAIGGAQHTLRADNRVATDMDGARRDAWAIAANAENYDLEDLM